MVVSLFQVPFTSLLMFCSLSLVAAVVASMASAGQCCRPVRIIQSVLAEIQSARHFAFPVLVACSGGNDNVLQILCSSAQVLRSCLSVVAFHMLPVSGAMVVKRTFCSADGCGLTAYPRLMTGSRGAGVFSYPVGNALQWCVDTVRLKLVLQTWRCMFGFAMYFGWKGQPSRARLRPLLLHQLLCWTRIQWLMWWLLAYWSISSLCVVVSWPLVSRLCHVKGTNGFWWYNALFLFLIDRVVRRAKESFGPTVCTISWLLSSMQISEHVRHLACAVGV